MSIRIIAEAGVNHNGSVEIARKMVDAAKDAGADYIKFQTFIPEKLVLKDAGKAKYQKQSTGEGESQLEMLRKISLEFPEFVLLQQYCQEKKIGFLSTPFDLNSIEFLKTLSMDFWKVPSGEVTNYPYLREIGKTGKEVVLSTGMCTLQEVEEALLVLREYGAGEVTLLQCNTEYPTPYRDVNLRAMNTLAQKFHTPIGYSDHTKGTEISIAAAALGATVIEKHFTLDCRMEGPDHKASLEPEELRDMIKGIRHVEEGLGTGRKEPSPSERPNIIVARKSVVAAKNIKRGDIFSEENLTTKRPGDGLSPMYWQHLIGEKAGRDYKKDERIGHDEI